MYSKQLSWFKRLLHLNYHKEQIFNDLFVKMKVKQWHKVERTLLLSNYTNANCNQICFFFMNLFTVVDHKERPNRLDIGSMQFHWCIIKKIWIWLVALNCFGFSLISVLAARKKSQWIKRRYLKLKHIQKYSKADIPFDTN